MRVVSQDALKQLLSENIDHVFTYALKITHPNLNGGTPYRIIGDKVGYTINGNYFEPIPFGVDMQAAEEDSLPTMTISVGNVDPDLITTIKTQPTSPDVETYVIMIDTAGNAYIELGPDNFSVLNVDWDDAAVNFHLGFERRFLQEPAMKWAFVPGVANGLFQ